MAQTIQEKIELLRAMNAPQVFELLKIEWGAPAGTIYYCTTQLDELDVEPPPVSPIEVRLMAEDRSEVFLPTVSDSSLGDEEIDLELWDADGVIADLVLLHGEGLKVELLYWFPQAELLLSHWWGHLRTADGADAFVWRGTAANGFRSPDLPLPRRAHYDECQAIFGAHLSTQAEIDKNDCPYNRHIGGNVGNLDANGQPFLNCPRQTRGDCTARLNDYHWMLSHFTPLEAVPNPPNNVAVSVSNRDLKEPVRVIMGWRFVRDLELLASAPQYNNSNPDKGFWRLLFEICEGPVNRIVHGFVGGQYVYSHPEHLAVRTGTKRQTPTAFSPTANNYSGTALIYYVFGWTNPANVPATNIPGAAWVEGLNDIAERAANGSITFGWTDNRVWQLFRMLSDKRWGFGLDESRFDLPAWTAAAIWANKTVDFVDSEGNHFPHVRARSDVDLRSKTTQEQVEDLCRAGRLSRPFIKNGKLSIAPLSAPTTAELAAAPVFTDAGANRNIIVDETGKSTLTRSQQSDLDLANRVETNFDDTAKENLEQPIAVEDVPQQLRAGRVLGDTTRRAVPKKFDLLGVTVRNQATKVAWSLLDFGEFDEGGIKNNLEISFSAWFLDCLELHATRVIKVESAQLDRYGFEYFRIKNLERESNLHIKIAAQAINVDALNDFEIEYAPENLQNVQINAEPFRANDGYETFSPDVQPLKFGDAVFSSDALTIQILEG